MKDHDLATRREIEIALLTKGQESRRYKLGEIWELNYDEIREALDELTPSHTKKSMPSAQPEPSEEWRKKHYERSYNQGFVDACKMFERRKDRGMMRTFQLCTDEIAQFTGEIIEIFEDFLEKKQIVIANDEKDEAITDGEDPACIGNIYGTDYGELQSDIEETLLIWRLVKEEK